MKKLLILLIISFTFTPSFSQEKPKLVVGIVVDQMRYDYVYRFWDDFSNDGFKKLMLNSDPGSPVKSYHLKQLISSSLYNYNDKSDIRYI